MLFYYTGALLYNWHKSKFIVEDILSIPDTQAGRLDIVLEELAKLHGKVDELLVDTRRVRPLMDRYIAMSGKMPWSALGKKS